MKRVLVIDDERDLAIAIIDRLSAEGYHCDAAYDGSSGLTRLNNGRYDLVILDVMMPGRNGFEVLQSYRRNAGTAAVLMLTARSSVADTVSGLRLGADDYLGKPFDMDVLLARIEALLRRTMPADGDALPGGSGPGSAVRTDSVNLDLPDFGFGPFTLVFRRAELLKDGTPVRLSYREFSLLAYLVSRRGELIRSETLLDELWGYEADVGTRTVYTHVAWLRRKLRTRERQDGYIRTVRNIGYMFCE
jgi:DNA-binding response OmpR family regulator